MPVLFAYSSRPAPLYLLCLGASRLLRSRLVIGSDPAGGQGSSGKWVPGPLHLPAAEATGKIPTIPSGTVLLVRLPVPAAPPVYPLLCLAGLD